MSEEVKGLTVIFTGDGKGKTSAALGVVFRALGHGFKCKIIQFIKGKMDTGEIRSAEKFAGQLELVRAGKGFTWEKAVPHEKHVEAAKKGIETARADLEKGECQVMVLDEILFALGAELVTLDEIKELINKKPDNVHLILTGRGAPSELIELADIVSEINSIKHPLGEGITAQKGLDY